MTLGNSMVTLKTLFSFMGNISFFSFHPLIRRQCSCFFFCQNDKMLVDAVTFYCSKMEPNSLYQARMALQLFWRMHKLQFKEDKLKVKHRVKVRVKMLTKLRLRS